MHRSWLTRKIIYIVGVVESQTGSEFSSRTFYMSPFLGNLSVFFRNLPLALAIGVNILYNI